MKSKLWRIAFITPRQEGDVAINSLHLYYAGERIDGAATLTASHAPIAGALSNLQQASPGAACVFSRQSAMSAGFYLQWSFAAETETDAFRVAAEGDFPGFILLGFIAGRWEIDSDDIGGVIGLTASSLSAVLPFYERATAAGATLYLPGDVKKDAVTGADWVLPAGAYIQNQINRSGLATLMVGKGASVYYPLPAPAFTNWTGGNLTIEGKVYIQKAATGDSGVPLFTYCGDAQGSIVYWSFGPISDGRLRFYFWSGAQNIFTTPTSVVPFGEFCDIALVISGTQLKFFVNGSLVHEAVRVNTPMGGGNSFLVHVNCAGGAGELSSGEFAVSDLLYTASAKYDANYSPTFVWQAAKAISPLCDHADIAHSTDVPEHSAHSAPPTQLARDMEFGGPGRVWGNAMTEIAPGTKVPTKARISILRQRDRLLARETWSDPVTGEWEVQGLDTAQQFIALAQDPSGTYRPVAADQSTPEAAP